MHQMGFAESHPSVDEQRVVNFGRGFGYRQRGGMGHLVIIADDEGVKGVARVQVGSCGKRHINGRNFFLPVRTAGRCQVNVAADSGNLFYRELNKKLVFLFNIAHTVIVAGEQDRQCMVFQGNQFQRQKPGFEGYIL